METDNKTTPAASDEESNYPLLIDRIQSSFIDLIFIVACMFVFSSALNKYENTPDWVRIALFAGIWMVYEPLCTTLGCTLGNYIKNLRVRKYTNPSKKINFLQALIRYIFKTGLGWISFLTINSNRQKRAIHDMVAGSVVVKDGRYK